MKSRHYSDRLASTASDVSLREYLEALISAERDTREMTMKDAGVALRIQATEYERRLENLNGEHGRLAELTGTFLRQETFQAWEQAHIAADDRLREADTLWKRGIDKQLAEQQGAANRTTAIITIALALLSIALRFWP